MKLDRMSQAASSILVIWLYLASQTHCFFQQQQNQVPPQIQIQQHLDNVNNLDKFNAVDQQQQQQQMATRQQSGQQQLGQVQGGGGGAKSPAAHNPLMPDVRQQTQSASKQHKLTGSNHKQHQKQYNHQQESFNNKSRQHLVSKIKDARHRRRRHRQQRHRHYRRSQKLDPAAAGGTIGPDGKYLTGDQLIQFQQFKAMIEKQQQQQQPLDAAQSGASLSALESIVEEVAQAGQQLATSGVQVVSPPMGVNHQPQQQQQQQQQSPAFSLQSMGSEAGQTRSAMSGLVSDLLLDGSSSPLLVQVKSTSSPASQTMMTPSASTRHQQQREAPGNIENYPLVQQAAAASQPSSLTSIRAAGGGGGGGGGNPLNSRGFFLTTMLSKIMNVLNVTEFAIEMRDGISSRASCMACNAVVGLFLSPLYSKEVFSAAIRTVCTSFKIQSPRVCAGLAESFQDDLDYIRKNTKLTRDEICGVVFGIDCARRPTYNLFWTVHIPRYHSKQQQLMDLQQQQQTIKNLDGTRPIQESSLINMDDAPDLFEYRRGGSAASSQHQQHHQGSGSDQSPGSVSISTSMTSSYSSTSSGGGESPTAIELSAPGMQEKSAKLVVAGSSSSKQRQPFTNGLTGSSSTGVKQQGKVSNDRHQQHSNRPKHTGVDKHNKNKHNNNNNNNKISSFVQITDIHIDPYYEPGSLSDCKEPLCCRATSGHVQPGDKRRQAGRWGDYGNCDLPVRTLRSALSRIREHHPDAEYWIWTGDITPHDIWNITKTEAANEVRLVTKMVREYSNGLPVFPVIGNHEAHPVNSFSPPEIKGRYSMAWLYELMAEEWVNWLPKDALETLKIGGYYKLQVRKGFRILALNTNYCARLNPWSFYDPVDPANQLKWLVDELLEAEMADDKVHIIGHVPPDNRECTQAWLFNFINIVDRFKDTIEAQFYGHTHRDEFRVMYSLKNSVPSPTTSSSSSSSSSSSTSTSSGQSIPSSPSSLTSSSSPTSSPSSSSTPSSSSSGSASASGYSSEEPVGVQFIGPSLTPFTENNPAYRIYHQDQTGRLVDAETYFFNLTEANERPDGEPRWQYSYSTQTDLNMTGLRANDWHQYVEKLHNDEELFDSFFKNFYRASDAKANQVCRYKCKHQILSDLKLSHPYKTKPKPFLANRKTSNHNHHHHHHQPIHHLHQLHNKRLRYTERSKRSHSLIGSSSSHH